MFHGPMDFQARTMAPRTDAKYVGTRTSSGPQVLVKTESSCGSLPPRPDLLRHSPPGFNWGRSGSGQAQLALALLADASGNDEFALKYHQVFQHEFIARLPKDRWELTGLQILQALRFVCEEAKLDPAETDQSEDQSGKVAVIRALLPGRDHDFQISARACGRSVRSAANRALLNLLGNRHLRQRSITNLQLELSIFNASEDRPEFADEFRR